jgi:DNA helicase-2/ATP-dependent DNA helicase PcrA
VPGDLPLTPEQRRAVESEARALEIRAGPGTGKTFTLAHRVARLAADPRQQARVLAVTFTREATASLDMRLSILLGRGHAVRVGSFHQWAARELPREDRRFLPEGEGRRLVAEGLGRASVPLGRALGVSPGSGEDAATRVLAFLSFLKNAETTLGRALATTHAGLAPWEDALANAQEAYEARKGDRLDYDDLLLTFRERLKRSAPFRDGVASRLDHLFVDEYQDVNAIQAESVRLLTAAKGGPSVTVVGDARQAIYGFRAGSPRHLESFLDAYGKEGKRVALTRSFRSSREIVAAANRLLPDEHALQPAPRAAGGVPPRLVPCADPFHEARWVADLLESLLAQGVEPADVVVLTRARHLALAFQEEALQRRADEAWASSHGALVDAAIEAFLALWRATGGRGGPRAVLDGLIDASAGPALRAAMVLERRARAAPLPALPKAKDLLALPRGGDLFHVQVSTIHAAKGLEWDHVVLVGARDGGIPSDHALSAPPEAQKSLLAEERRLLYVALTRARKTFTATWPEKVDRRSREMSRFLAPLLPAPRA